jgi:hypothetical protein
MLRWAYTVKLTSKFPTVQPCACLAHSELINSTTNNACLPINYLLAIQRWSSIPKTSIELSSRATASPSQREGTFLSSIKKKCRLPATVSFLSSNPKTTVCNIPMMYWWVLSDSAYSFLICKETPTMEMKRLPQNNSASEASETWEQSG